jgi:hypothetical protein
VLRTEKKERRTLGNVALTKTSLALHETDYFYQDYKRDGANLEAQRRLAGLWDEAAIAGHEVNPELASVFSQKSYFHTVYGDYPKYKDPQIGIDLASVRQKISGAIRAPCKRLTIR